MSDGGRPELRDLALALNQLSWNTIKEVTHFLEVPKHKLDDIEETYPRSIHSRKLSALETWLHMDIEASWGRLVEAVYSCGQATTAQEIQMKYCPTYYSHIVPYEATTPHATAVTRPALSDGPSLVQLKRLKVPGERDICIIDHVSGNWSDIAIMMDFDRTGRTQTAINKDFDTVAEKCTETFKRWLGGEGSKQPATWEVLLDILRDCNFEKLAEDIEKNLS